MLCQFLIYSRVNQLYVYIYPLFYGFPSHLGHHRALSRVPCAIQFSLIIYFIHNINSVYMSISISQFIPPPPCFPPQYPYVCSLCLCLYFCFVNKIIYTIFSHTYAFITALILIISFCQHWAQFVLFLFSLVVRLGCVIENIFPETKDFITYGTASMRIILY